MIVLLYFIALLLACELTGERLCAFINVDKKIICLYFMCFVENRRWVCTLNGSFVYDNRVPRSVCTSRVHQRSLFLPTFTVAPKRQIIWFTTKFNASVEFCSHNNINWSDIKSSSDIALMIFAASLWYIRTLKMVPFGGCSIGKCSWTVNKMEKTETEEFNSIYKHRMKAFIVDFQRNLLVTQKWRERSPFKRENPYNVISKLKS